MNNPVWECKVSISMLKAAFRFEDKNVFIVITFKITTNLLKKLINFRI